MTFVEAHFDDLVHIEIVGGDHPPAVPASHLAADDGAGDAWANSNGAEVHGTMRAAAPTVRVRQSGERANDERLMLSRE